MSIDLLQVFNEGLSSKEKQVVQALLAGKSVAEIAETFHRSVKTVETQKASAYRKLGVKNTVQLLHFLHPQTLKTTDGLSGGVINLSEFHKLRPPERAFLLDLAEKTLSQKPIHHAQIARDLGMSTAMVHDLEHEIMEKLGLNNARELVLAGLLARAVFKNQIKAEPTPEPSSGS